MGPIVRVITHQVGFFIVIGFLLAAVILLVSRWQQSQGVPRAQYRWLFLGAFTFLLVIAGAQFLPEDNVGQYLWILAGNAIPVTIGVAILRYRLYEIDRIISRTVSYALLAGLLGLVFFGLTALFTTFLPSDDPLVVAAATLAVAALFKPGPDSGPIGRGSPLQQVPLRRGTGDQRIHDVTS